MWSLHYQRDKVKPTCAIEIIEEHIFQIAHGISLKYLLYATLSYVHYLSHIPCSLRRLVERHVNQFNGNDAVETKNKNNFYGCEVSVLVLDPPPCRHPAKDYPCFIK